MIRNIKVLGLALAAVLALTAIAASAASAAEFHAEESPITLSGTQTTTNVFHTDAGEVTCKKATYSGTTTGVTTSTQKVTPKYEECHAIFFGITVSTPVDVNGCEYELSASAGTAKLICSGTVSRIEVTAPGCTTTIKAANNTAINGISYTNEGTGSSRSIIVDTASTNIAYEEVPTSSNTCASANQATTGGSYTGSVTVSGKNSLGVAKGIWWL